MANPDADTITIEVVLACPDQQWLRALDVPAGTSVGDAVRHCITRFGPFPGCDVDVGQCTLGVFGCVVEATAALRHGDRVEIYRPLQQDPRSARRHRATRR